MTKFQEERSQSGDQDVLRSFIIETTDSPNVSPNVVLASSQPPSYLDATTVIKILKKKTNHCDRIFRRKTYFKKILILIKYFLFYNVFSLI